MKKTAIFFGALAMVTLFAAQNALAGQCRDPWVTQAIQQVKGRAPVDNYESGECNIRNFNNGSWGSYPELLGYVQKYFNSRPSLASGARPAIAGGVNAGSMLRGGSNPNGIVAAGGGNIVAAGGGNIVAAGGGNIVAAGGGN